MMMIRFAVMRISLLHMIFFPSSIKLKFTPCYIFTCWLVHLPIPVPLRTRVSDFESRLNKNLS